MSQENKSLGWNTQLRRWKHRSDIISTRVDSPRAISNFAAHFLSHTRSNKWRYPSRSLADLWTFLIFSLRILWKKKKKENCFYLRCRIDNYIIINVLSWYVSLIITHNLYNVLNKNLFLILFNIHYYNIWIICI